MTPRDIADGLAKATEDFCPHPARRGFHEVYGKADGASFCRACGFVFPTVIGREVAAELGGGDELEAY